MTDNNLSRFGPTVINIIKNLRQGVGEYRQRFVEGDAMFGAVGPRLAAVPFELHSLGLRGILGRVPNL